METVEGIDVSYARVKRSWWRKHREQRVLVQNLWPGGWAGKDALRKVAPANLADALAEGRIVAGYIVVTPDQPGRWYGAADYFEAALAEARLRAGDAWSKLHSLWVDVETLEADGVTFWPSEALAFSWAERLAAIKPTGVYTARWFVDAYYRGNMGAEWARYPLWIARYGVPPSLNQALGPWKQVTGHQYQGSVTIDGVTLDRNIFSAAYFLAPEERLKDLQARLELVTLDRDLRAEAATLGAQGLWKKLRRFLDSWKLGK